MTEKKFKKAEMRQNDGMSLSSSVIQIRPDLEWERRCDREWVVQYYWGNVSCWDRPLHEMDNLLNVIADNMPGGKTPTAILIDGYDPSGEMITVHTGTEDWEPDEYDQELPAEPILWIHTGKGDVTVRDGGTRRKIANGARWAQCDFGVDCTIFATLAGWRWPDLKVYSWYIRGNNRVELVERDKFEL